MVGDLRDSYGGRSAQRVADAPDRVDQWPAGRADLLRLAQDMLVRRLRQAEGRGDVELARLLDEWRQGTCPAEEAAERLLRFLSAVS